MQNKTKEEEIEMVVSKIFYSPATNGQAEASIKAGIEDVKKLIAAATPASPSMQWVKASERLPESAGRELIVRVTGGELQDKKIICLGWFHSEGKQIDATREKVTLSYSGYALSKVEWLDENPSPTLSIKDGKEEVDRLLREYKNHLKMTDVEELETSDQRAIEWAYSELHGANK